MSLNSWTASGCQVATEDRHEYELYLAVENIDHTRTKVRSPQTNGICERFHKTLLDNADVAPDKQNPTKAA